MFYEVNAQRDCLELLLGTGMVHWSHNFITSYDIEKPCSIVDMHLKNERSYAKVALL